MNIIALSALSLVRSYQKYISPHKGFVCAHRALYGGASCSQYYCETIMDKGLFMATLNLLNRGKECRAAAMFLASVQSQNREKNSEESKGRPPWTDPVPEACKECATWVTCCFPW